MVCDIILARLEVLGYDTIRASKGEEGVRIISRNKVDIKIARPSQQARTLFELTGLDRVFDIIEDLDQAIKSFS